MRNEPFIQTGHAGSNKVDMSGKTPGKQTQLPYPVDLVATLLLDAEQLPMPALVIGDIGSDGRVVRPRIRATTDREAVAHFLSRFASNSTTLRRYKIEANRLLLWLAAQGRGRGLNRPLQLSEIDLTDVGDYLMFLKSPPLSWCAPPHQMRLRSGSINPLWRPMVGPLSDNTLVTTRAILDSLFQWLIDAKWLVNENPFALFPSPNKDMDYLLQVDARRHQVSQRLLSHEAREAISRALTSLPRNTKTQIVLAARARMIVASLLYLGLCIDELSRVRYKDFYMVATTNAPGDCRAWCLNVVGRGDRTRTVAIPSSYYDELESYRKVCGLPAILDSREEDLMLGIKKRQIHNVLKGLLRAAASLAQHPDTKGELEKASAHWFRNTSITLQEQQGINYKHRLAQAGHTSERAASLYEHSELHEQLEAFRDFSVD